jgi:sigma-B regulation protein RsbU (phosphoserine phosphatase)
VAGHGVGAALMMANFRACLRIESRNNFAIRTILAKVNDYLIESDLPGSYVTAFYGVLDRRNHRLTYANAGHNAPFVAHSNGKFEILDTGGLLLGSFEQATYQETTLDLQKGDILVFYTDGVTESRDGSGKEFGTESLKRLVRKYRDLSASNMVQRICEDVLKYQSSEIGRDDLTLSIVKYV